MSAITPAIGAAHARILGVGGYQPSRVITNQEVSTWIETSDEWIQQRTGIVERRWAAPEESVVDMAYAAATDAMARSGIAAAQIDAIVMSTVTFPYQTPSAATLLAHRLGATPAAAFDISAACAGFCYGVSLANDMVRGGSAGHVLVVGVEKLSDFTDTSDRSTAFIFADGAGAVVIGPSDHPGIGPTIWGSDGAQWDAVGQRTSWLEARTADRAGVAAGSWPAIQQQGQSVFRWAVWQMAPVAQKALDAAGVGAADLSAFIPHQANARIIDALAKQIGLPTGVAIARDIAHSGNTSAASIPLAMRRMIDDGTVTSGGLALLIGFGAGLVYAAQVVEIP